MQWFFFLQKKITPRRHEFCYKENHFCDMRDYWYFILSKISNRAANFCRIRYVCECVWQGDDYSNTSNFCSILCVCVQLKSNADLGWVQKQKVVLSVLSTQDVWLSADSLKKYGQLNVIWLRYVFMSISWRSAALS